MAVDGVTIAFNKRFNDYAHTLYIV
jgi:hypothetical protein